MKFEDLYQGFRVIVNPWMRKFFGLNFVKLVNDKGEFHGIGISLDMTKKDGV